MSYNFGSGGLLRPRHKVFVSFHHRNDWSYRLAFEQLLTKIYDIMVSKSVQIGEIPEYLATETVRQKIRDEYLRDSTVTVVLIGAKTWQRKHVDWEIASSIRHTQCNPRSGLIGIVLPTYPRTDITEYNKHTIPPRLSNNIECGFAKIYNWNADPVTVQGWIHEAYQRRNRISPDNSYSTFVNNKFGSQWQ